MKAKTDGQSVGQSIGSQSDLERWARVRAESAERRAEEAVHERRGAGRRMRDEARDGVEAAWVLNKEHCAAVASGSIADMMLSERARRARAARDDKRRAGRMLKVNQARRLADGLHAAAADRSGTVKVRSLIHGGRVKGGIVVSSFKLTFDDPFVRKDRNGDPARSQYVAWWHGIEARQIEDTARRLAGSVRSGRVSITSRDEARATARANLVAAAESLVRWGWAWAQAVRIATRDDDTCKAALAAAIKSLRGEVMQGGRGRNGMVKGSESIETAEQIKPVWDVMSGEWIEPGTNSRTGETTEPIRRADGCEFYDLAGRLVTEGESFGDFDTIGARWARDAGKLVVWLAGQRCGVRGNWPAATRSRVRASAAKLARVLRQLARGETMPLACLAVGWSWDGDRKRSDGFRRAVDSLTMGAGLSVAWRDYRAAQA